MKLLKLVFVTILLFTVTNTYSQVGIGNTNPQAALDIEASDSSSPTNNDGVLIPRVSNFPSTNPTASQDGMLVFYTGAGASGKGFYYWNQNTSNWLFVAGAKRINELSDGVEDGSSIFLGANSGVNDDGNNNQNTGLGIGALQQNTSGQFNTGVGYASLGNNSDGFGNTALGSESLRLNTNGNTNTALGMFSLYSNSTASGNTAIGFNALQSATTGGSNVAIGDWAGRNTNGTGNVIVGSLALEQNMSGSNNIAIGDNAANQNYNASGSVFIGSNAGYNETNGNRLYIENSSSDENNALIYGEFDTHILRANAELQIGNPSTTGFAFPVTDGSASQIMTTDGSGTMDFVDASTLFTDTNTTYDGTDFALSNQSLPAGQFLNGISAAGTLIGAVPNDSDNQNIQGSGLSGTDLTIGIENGTSEIVNLSSLVGVERINDLIDGKSDNDGTNNGSSIFLGIDAGTNDDGTNNRNIGLGYRSLSSNIDGSANVAIGNSSLSSNTDGERNVAYGASALLSNTTGASNTAIGYLSLYNNIDGNNNIAIGERAMRYGTSGSSNIAIGFSTLNRYAAGNSGDSNIAIGSYSLHSNSTGSSNVAIGRYSLNSNTTGSSNVAIGYHAGENSSGNNKLYIENSSANADNALIYGEFDNDILRTNSEFQIGNPTSNGYAFPTTDGTNNQILVTDGSGAVSFVNASTVFTNTDEQTIDTFSFNTSTNELTLEIEDDGIAAQTVDLSSLNNGNTLDDAYDQGSAGAGKTIDATDGAVTINGEDGFLVTGTHGSGNTIDTEITGAGTRMFFNPNRSAFRAGYIDGTQWDNANIGAYSIAMGEGAIASSSFTIALGRDPVASGASSVALGWEASASGASANAMNYQANASGDYALAFGREANASGEFATAIGYDANSSNQNSVAIGHGTISSGIGSVAIGQSTSSTAYRSLATGYANVASGDYATAMGRNTVAPSAYETTLGVFSTLYTPSSTTAFNSNDKLFAIGNGNNATNRSNALTVYKSGLLNINDEYDMPLTDGTINQVMTTDGAGHVTFSTLNEESTSANNGLTETGGNIQLGGTLTQDTNINYGTFDTRFNLNDTGDFIIQANGTGVFEINNGGTTTVGRDMVWRDTNITGTIIAQMIDDGDDGRFVIRENGNINVDLNANTEYIFNQQGDDRDFRVESNGNTNMLLVNAGSNEVGVGGNPDTDLHVYHSDTAASAGFKIQNQGTNNNWWRMFSSNATGNLFIYSTSGGATPRGNFNNATGAYSATSDRRLKKDFIPLRFTWQSFMQLEPLSYLYKTQKNSKRSLGLIAQDVENIYPELVTHNKESDVYHLNYSGFGVVAIKAIQELKDEVDILKQENVALKAKLSKLETLEARLTALENNKNH